MSILKCMEEDKLRDGKERSRMLFSYGRDIDENLLKEVLENFKKKDDTVVFTIDPDTPATPELEEEMKEMDDMMFFSSPALWSVSPERTIRHDIPFMIGQGVLPFSVEQKGKKWLNLLDEVFLTIYHTKGEKELSEMEVKKLITEALRVVTRDYEKDVPKELQEPLCKARLDLTKEIMEEETSYTTKMVYGTALLNWGNLSRLQKKEDAFTYLREAYLLFTSLTEERPSWDSVIFSSKSASIAASIFDATGEVRKAKRWYRRCAEHAETLRKDKSMKEHPEMPELDTVYIDAMMHLSRIYEEEGALRDALDSLFKADLAIKEYPTLVPPEVVDAIGLHIDELASHVLNGFT